MLVVLPGLCSDVLQIWGLGEERWEGSGRGAPRATFRQREVWSEGRAEALRTPNIEMFMGFVGRVSGGIWYKNGGLQHANGEQNQAPELCLVHLKIHHQTPKSRY